MKTTSILTALLLVVSIQASAQINKFKKAVIPTKLSTSAVAGQKIYLQYCLTCHMIDGNGVPNMNPPLVNTSYVKGDKTKLIKVVLNGLPPNTDIDGQAYTNSMPAQTMLTEQQVADVLTYVRSSFGNKYSPVKVTEVKAVKATQKK